MPLQNWHLWVANKSLLQSLQSNCPVSQEQWLKMDQLIRPLTGTEWHRVFRVAPRMATTLTRDWEEKRNYEFRTSVVKASLHQGRESGWICCLEHQQLTHSFKRFFDDLQILAGQALHRFLGTGMKTLIFILKELRISLGKSDWQENFHHAMCCFLFDQCCGCCVWAD